jgi:hypothetical protein
MASAEQFVQRSKHPFVLVLLLSTVAGACAVKMSSAVGPDGNPWQTCDGDDDKCVEAVGAKCPSGYVVGAGKTFNCKADRTNDQGSCVTDKELATTVVFALDDADNVLELRPGHLTFGADGPLVKAKPVRGPDCHVWLMRPSFDWSSSSSSSTSRFSKLLGRACEHGYVEADLFGQALYQCKSRPEADLPDAHAGD